MIRRLAPLFALALLSTLRAASPDSEAAGAVAEKFINTYLTASANFTEGYESTIAWVGKSKLVTKDYETAITKLYRDALQDDPEMGYGADAVISGQDYPDAGFKVKTVKVDGDQARVILTSKDKEFPMEIPVVTVKQGDTWLVDQSGDLVK